MRRQLGGVVSRRLLALWSQLRYPGGEQRGIFFEHPEQTPRAINLGLNRKHRSFTSLNVSAHVTARASTPKIQT